MPMSSVSERQRSSHSASNRSAMRSSRAWRSKGVHFDHGPSKAARAAFPAASMSAAVPRGTVASSVPSAGLRASITSPDRASLHWPSMNIGRNPPS